VYTDSDNGGIRFDGSDLSDGNGTIIYVAEKYGNDFNGALLQSTNTSIYLLGAYERYMRTLYLNGSPSYINGRDENSADPQLYTFSTNGSDFVFRNRGTQYDQ
jgi:hypothetical protein